MIPRTLHQIWLSGSPAVPAFEEWSARWRELHPGWSYVRWEECPPEFTVAPLFDAAADLVPAESVAQFRADVLRYELLEKFGGVYVDMDFEPRRSLETILTPAMHGFAAYEAPNGKWVNNAILGSVPGATFLAHVIESLPASIASHHGARANVVSGPQHLTRSMHFWPSRWEIFDSALFYPYRWDELERAGEEFPDAIAVHHWSNKAGLARA